MSEGRRASLSDGRLLAFEEWGDPGGHPVLECHGNPGSRMLLWQEEVLARLGVRMITVDRPGIGGSSRLPGRTVGGWADDVRELLDAVGVGRFAVLGYSVGGAYAAACAHHLSDRVDSLALVSSVVPLGRLGALADLGRAGQWRLARRAPALAAAALSAQAAVLGVSPRFAVRAFSATLPGPDRAAIARHPDLVPRALEMAGEAVRQGGHGLVEDLRTVMRPWGFDLGEVATPTTVWHGDRDRSIPLAWGRRLAEAIPGAQLRISRGDGHLLLADRLPDVVRSLTVVV